MSGDPTFFVLPVTHSEEGDLEGWGVMNTVLRFKQVQTEQKWYTNYNNLLNSRLPTAALPLVFIFPPTLERKDFSTSPHLPLPWARDSITSLPTAQPPPHLWTFSSAFNCSTCLSQFEPERSRNAGECKIHSSPEFQSRSLV